MIIAIPPTSRVIPTVIGEKRYSVMYLCVRNPKIAAGKKATARFVRNLHALDSNDLDNILAISFFR